MDSQEEHFQIFGGPASPYSMKLRAVFRYRRIPHYWLVPQSGFTGEGRLGEGSSDSLLNRAAKGVVPVVMYPNGEFKSDSTPIMLELESLYSRRSIIPPSPSIAFIARLIEDMADECMPLPMFYFRWTIDADWCGRRQMIGWNGALADRELNRIASAFIERQQTQLGIAAQLSISDVQKNVESILGALESGLKKSLFFFGTRPSIAEFGLFGQLSQYVVDPYIASVTKKRALRTFQWTQLLDDASGVCGEWADPAQCLTDELLFLVKTLAPFYFSLQDMARGSRGLDDLGDEINGPGYRLKCLLSLKQELANLQVTDRNNIEGFLKSAGCWDRLQFQSGEPEKVVKIAPQ